MADFPQQVNTRQAPGIAGAPCDFNPRSVVLSDEGAFVASQSGLTIGRFAWADPTNTILSNTGAGAPTGFVSRLTMNGINSTFLSGAGYQYLPGTTVADVFNSGSFWVKNDGSTTATYGMNAYTNNSTGQIGFGTSTNLPFAAATTGTSATIQPIVSATSGGAIPLAANTTCTGSITGSVLTVTAIATNCCMGVGQVLSGGTSTTGIIDPNTAILSQLTGATVGGAGTYQLNISQTVSSTTISMSGGCMKLTGANPNITGPGTPGVFLIGMTITGSGTGSNIPAGTTITGYGAVAANGSGYYLLSAPASGTAVSSSTITASTSSMFYVDTASGGTFSVGDVISGGASTPTAGTVITANSNTPTVTNPNINAYLTGTGGAGTYITSNSQTIAAGTAFSAATGTVTKWVYAGGGSAPGEICKMTSHLNG